MSVLIKSFAAIFCGHACVRLNFINLQMGEMKAMGFYVGKIALPLLIFNTVVTADLGTVSWGLVASCNLSETVGFHLGLRWRFWLARQHWRQNCHWRHLRVLHCGVQRLCHWLPP